ncbi:MAG: hypothetical protein EXX96DRAFT_555667 [Benjaminiella poitrasii]|nr:MAG: hypothetical protein EXX96DRAFT_555667 [Benjaminiella poitrasii]
MLRVYSILYLENVWSRPKQTTVPPSIVQQVQEPSTSLIMNNEEQVEEIEEEENEINYGTITTYSTVIVMDDDEQVVATTTSSRQQDDEAVVIGDQDNDMTKTQQLQETNDSPIINPPSDIPNNQTTSRTTLMQPDAPLVCSPGMTTADIVKDTDLSSLEKEESRRGLKRIHCRIDTTPPPQQQQDKSHQFSPRRILQRAKSSMMTAADDNVLGKLKRRSSQFMLLDRQKKSNQPHFANPTFITVPSIKHSFSSSSSSTTTLSLPTSLISARKRSSVLLTEKRKSITRKLKTVLSFHRP